MDNVLDKIYYNPKIGFKSAFSLYKNAIKIKRIITRAQVKKWLEKQPAYTMQKSARKIYPRTKVMVSAIDEQFQIDLVYLQSLANITIISNISLLVCIFQICMGYTLENKTCSKYNRWIPNNIK